MKENHYEGTANTLRGDPINGPHNTAAEHAPGKTAGAKKKKPEDRRKAEDRETDGGLMMTKAEILDFSEGADSLP